MYCGIYSSNLPGNLAIVGKAERVDREWLLVRSDCVDLEGENDMVEYMAYCCAVRETGRLR